MGDNFVFDYFREEGIAMGLVKGRKEGIQEGIEQGIREGALKEARQSILKVLKLRFGEVSSDLASKIESLRDLQRLEDLLGQAVLAPTLVEFESQI